MMTCLVIVAVGLCLLGSLGAAGWLFGDQIVDFVTQVLNGTPPAGEEVTTTGTGSLSVQSGQAGVLSSASGAQVEIPAGAVPPKDDGTPGTMVFSIEEETVQETALAGDFTLVGPVYRLGPEGFTFALPVKLSLPIPDGVDPANVMGLTFFDTATNGWTFVPAGVDTTAGTVTVETTHLSLWGLWSARQSADQWRREHGGWFQVRNTHTRGSDSYPGGRHLPMSTWYGICIQTYAFDNPSDGQNWRSPYEWKITVSDGASTDYWVPAGQYTLVEVYGRSEINNAPLYVPEYSTYWRPLGDYIVAPGDTLEFTPQYRFNETPADAVQGAPPCWGEMTTAVGTGDVQVTLTWHAEADIDLYVEDPNGDVVWYSNTSVPSGGQLDRDNKCSNFIMGRPENIFWPAGEAPQGTYKVLVQYYEDCTGSTGPVQWTVRTIVMGQVETMSGTLNSVDDEYEVTTFTVP